MKAAYLLLPVLLLSACGSVPKDRFYVLGSGEAAVSSAPAKYTVAISTVTIPEVVDRPQLVLYQPDNQVTLLEHERWAEPLKAAIAGAVARELRTQLPEARVAFYPQAAVAEAQCRISLDVQRFESRRGDSALIEALWSVRCGDGKALPGRSLVRESTQGNGYDALVNAHARALSQLGREIALGIKNSSTAIAPK